MRTALLALLFVAAAMAGCSGSASVKSTGDAMESLRDRQRAITERLADLADGKSVDVAALRDQSAEVTRDLANVEDEIRTLQLKILLLAMGVGTTLSIEADAELGIDTSE